MSPQAVDAQRIRSALTEVLEREGIPERPPEPSALQRWLTELFSGDLAQVVFHPLTWMILGAVVAAVLVSHFARRAGGDRSTRESARTDDRVRTRRVAELRERARAAEESGELADALRLHLFALVLGLSEHGDLEFRAAWTNRELLQRGKPRPDVAARLAALFDELDPKVFGREPAQASDLRRMDDLHAELLSGTPA